MNNILIPLNPHTNILAVEVPDDAAEIYLESDKIGYWLVSLSKSRGFVNNQLSGKIKLLGTVKNKVIDFDCEEYVKELPTYKDWFSHNPMYETDAEQECFLSLMESNNLYLTKHYVILQKL